MYKDPCLDCAVRACSELLARDSTTFCGGGEGDNVDSCAKKVFNESDGGGVGGGPQCFYSI